MSKKEFNPDAKILHLILKKQWFDAVCKDKREEYREIKPYWFVRLVFQYKKVCNYFGVTKLPINQYSLDRLLSDKQTLGTIAFNQYDYVSFTNGYRKDAGNIVLKYEGIRIGTGKEEWGAEKDKKYFVIKLGEMITFKF